MSFIARQIAGIVAIIIVIAIGIALAIMIKQGAMPEFENLISSGRQFKP